MAGCRLCPRNCGADRSIRAGMCGCTALPRVARAALHFWEEPYISGTRGSGAIFFSGCNLDCVFCQNREISHIATDRGGEYDARGLAGIMLALEAEGAHNINLVTPAPHVETLIPAIELAKRGGLSAPIVYNTNAYEKVETLKRLDGLIDIYLPDVKYVSGAASERYSGAVDYFEYARPAVLEMFSQAGTLTLDDEGIAVSGLAIRHLVLPCGVGEARSVLSFIADELPQDTYVSLMSQYVPMYGAKPPIDRRLLRREYDRAVDCCIRLGLKNVYLQEAGSASKDFVPPFDESVPKTRPN